MSRERRRALGPSSLQAAARFRRRALVAAVLASLAPSALANPEGAHVVSGQASLATQGSVLSVTTSANAILEWQRFSIGAGETTRFIQPSTASSVLNRVVGTDPSVILGHLQSNGQVFLINPSGVLFGEGARVDVAGLVASTLNLSNADYLAGRLRFEGGGAGAVVNRGVLGSVSGGSIFLVGPAVENHGLITAPDGQVLLAAGQRVRLGSTATPNVLVELEADAGRAVNLGRIAVGRGEAGLHAALVEQRGVVSANNVAVEGGRVVFRASRDLTVAAGSRTEASGSAGGSVRLEAGGTALVAGQVSATGTAAAGGRIVLTGTHAALTGSAALDASGATGGGQVFLGGGLQGTDPTIANARALYLGADTRVAADATRAGAGGQVVLWSETATRSHGHLSARGAGGPGGLVETSSHGWLDVTRIPVTGAGGRWLLDPLDVTIGAASDANISAGPVFEPSTSPAALSVASIQAALEAGTSVTVTTAVAGAEAGDITLTAPLTAANPAAGSATLTLLASRDLKATFPIHLGSSLALVATAGRNVDLRAVTAGVVNLTAQTGAMFVTDVTSTSDGQISGPIFGDGTGPIVIGGSAAQALVPISSQQQPRFLSLSAGGNLVVAGTIVSQGNTLLQSTGGQVLLSQTQAQHQVTSGMLEVDAYRDASLSGDVIATAGVTARVRKEGGTLVLAGGVSSPVGVTLQADEMEILGQVSVPGSLVTIQPETDSRTLRVGDAVVAGALNLSPAELSRISAAEVRLGSPLSTASDLVVATALGSQASPFQVGTLTLNAGVDLRLLAPVTTSGALVLQASRHIVADTVATLSASGTLRVASDAGSVRIPGTAGLPVLIGGASTQVLAPQGSVFLGNVQNTGHVDVAALGAVNVGGITASGSVGLVSTEGSLQAGALATNGGGVSLQSRADLLVTAPIQATGSVSLTVNRPGGLLDLGASVSNPGSTTALQADRINLGATVTANEVSIQPFSAGRDVRIEAAPSGQQALSLTPDGLSRLVANRLSLASESDLFLLSPLVSNVPDLELRGRHLHLNQPLNAGVLTLQAAGDLVSGDLAASAGSLSLTARSASTGILSAAAAVSVQTTGALATGNISAGGNVTLASTHGAVTLPGSVTTTGGGVTLAVSSHDDLSVAGTLTATGAGARLYLGVNRAGGLLTIAPGAFVSANGVASGGFSTFMADDVEILAPVNVAGDALAIQTYEPTRAVVVGTRSQTGAAELVLSLDELLRVTAGNTPGAPEGLLVSTGGRFTVNADINPQSLPAGARLSFSGGELLLNLTVNTPRSVSLYASDDLRALFPVSSGGALRVGGGYKVFTSDLTGATVSVTSAYDASTGAVTATAGEAYLDVERSLNVGGAVSATGDVTLSSGRVLYAPAVTSTGGRVSLQGGEGIYLMSSVNAGTGLEILVRGVEGTLTSNPGVSITGGGDSSFTADNMNLSGMSLDFVGHVLRLEAGSSYTRPISINDGQQGSQVAGALNLRASALASIQASEVRVGHEQLARDRGVLTVTTPMVSQSTSSLVLRGSEVVLKAGILWLSGGLSILATGNIDANATASALSIDAGGAVQLTAETGRVLRSGGGGATVSGASVTITAAHGVDLTGVTGTPSFTSDGTAALVNCGSSVNAPCLNLTGQPEGDVTLVSPQFMDVDYIRGRNVSLTAAGDIRSRSGAIVADVLNLNAGGALVVTTVAREIHATAATEITVRNTGSLSNSSFTLTAPGELHVETTGNLDISSLAPSGTGSVIRADFFATGAVNLPAFTTTGRVYVTGHSLSVAGIDAGELVNLTATGGGTTSTGEIRAVSGLFVGGLGDIRLQAPVVVTGASADVYLSAEGASITVDSLSVPLDSASRIDLEAGRDITINGIVNTPRLSVVAGEYYGSGFWPSTATFTLGTNGSIRAGTSPSSYVEVIADQVQLLGSVQANDAWFETMTENVALGNASVSGAMQIDAPELARVTVDQSLTIRTRAGRSITVGTLPAGVFAGYGSVSLTGQDITLTNDLVAGNVNLSLQANRNLTAGAIGSGSYLGLTAQGAIVVGDLSAFSVNLSARSIQAGAITADASNEGSIDVLAGRFDLSGPLQAGGRVQLTESGADGTLALPQITSDNLVVQTTRDLQIASSVQVSGSLEFRVTRPGGQIQVAGQASVAGGLAGGGASHVLEADRMDLQSDLGSGDLTLRPNDPLRPVVVGGAAADSLVLPLSSLARVSSGRVYAGRTESDLSVAQPVSVSSSPLSGLGLLGRTITTGAMALPGSTGLQMIARDRVDAGALQAAHVNIASQQGVVTTGSIDAGEVSVTGLAGVATGALSASGGGVSLQSAQGPVVLPASIVSSGNLSISSRDDLVVTAGTSLLAAHTLDLSVTRPGGAIQVQPGALVAGGTGAGSPLSTLRADVISLSDTVGGGLGTLRLQPWLAARGIRVGTTADSLALDLSPASLGRLRAAGLSLYTDKGDLSVDVPVSAADVVADTVELSGMDVTLAAAVGVPGSFDATALRHLTSQDLSAVGALSLAAGGHIQTAALSAASVYVVADGGHVSVGGITAGSDGLGLEGQHDVTAGAITSTGPVSISSYYGAASTGAITADGSIAIDAHENLLVGSALSGSSISLSVTRGGGRITLGSAGVLAPMVEGTLTFDADEVYLGGSVPLDGALLAWTPPTSPLGFALAPGGVLSGNGTVDLSGGSLLVQGTLRPGGSQTAGTLTVLGDVVLSAGSTVDMELGGDGNTDLVQVIGSLALAGTLSLQNLTGYLPQVNETATLLTASGPITGVFASLPAGATPVTVTGIPNTWGLTVNACQGFCWDGGAGTFLWTDPANWTGDRLPAAGDLVQINRTGGVTVVLGSGTHTVLGLQTASGNHLVLTGGSLTVTGTAVDSTLGGDLRLEGGRLVLDGGLATLSHLSLAAGTLAGSGAVVVTGAFDLGGGSGARQLSGTGTFTTRGTSTLDPTGAAGQTLVLSGGRTWINEGTLVIGGDTALVFGTAGQTETNVLRNTATGTLQLPTSSATPMTQAGGTAVLENAGTLTAGTAGTRTLDLSLVDNTGSLGVAAGTLVLSGALTQSGVLALGNNGTLRVAAGFTNAVGGRITGSGTLDLQGGTLINQGSIEPAGAGTLEVQGAVTHESGRLGSGSGGVLKASGRLHWTGGDIQDEVQAGSLVMDAATARTLSVRLIAGSARLQGGTLAVTLNGSLGVTGSLTVDAGTTLTLNDGQVQVGGALANAGTVRVLLGTLDAATLANNGGSVRLEGGASTLGSLDNTASGTVDQVSGQLALGPVANAGTLTLGGGSLTRTAAAGFSNTGTVNLGAGTLLLDGGDGDQGGGTWNIASGATLDFAAGSHTLGQVVNAGTLLVSGGTVQTTAGMSNTLTGSVVVSSGSLALGALLGNNGSFRFSGGSLQLAAVTQRGTLVLDAAGYGRQAQAPFRNSGQVQVNAGTLSLDGGGGILVDGTYGVGPAGALRFTAGTYTLAGITGSGPVSVAGATVQAGVISHGGVVRVDSGSLQVTGSASSLLDQLQVSGGSFVAGTTVNVQNLQLGGGDVASTGTGVLRAAALDWSAGSISGAVVAGSATLSGTGGRILSGRLSAGEAQLQGGDLGVTATGELRLVASTSPVASGDLRVAAGATLQLQQGALVDVAGQLTIDGTLVTGLVYGTGGQVRALTTLLNRGVILSEGGDLSLGDFTNVEGTLVWREGRLAVGALSNIGGNLDLEGQDLVRDAAAVFGNSGTLKLARATLDLAGGEGGVSGGVYKLPGADARVIFRAGQYAPAEIIEGVGIVQVSGAGVRVSRLEIPGRLEVSSGSFTLAATTGAPAANVNDLLLSDGRVAVESGTLNLTAGSLQGGVLSVGPTGVLVAQSVSVSGGGLASAGSVSVQQLNLAGGLAGTVDGGSLLVQTLDWSSGGLRGEVEAASVILSGSADRRLESVLQTDGMAANGGSLTVVAGGSLLVEESVVVAAGARLVVGGGSVGLTGTLGNAGTVRLASGSLAVAAVDNTGIFTVAGGSLARGAGAVFSNRGTVNLTAGELVLDGGDAGQGGGTWNVAAGARLALTGGDQQFGRLNLGGALDVSAGSATVARLQVAAGGEYRQSGGSVVVAAGAPLLNGGTVELAGGSLQTGVVRNAGLFRVAGGSLVRDPNTEFGNTGTVEVNSGFLELAGGEGASSGGTYRVGVGAELRFTAGTYAPARLESDGAIDEISGQRVAGTLVVDGATVSAGSVGLGGSTRLSAGRLSVSAASTAAEVDVDSGVLESAAVLAVDQLRMSGGTLASAGEGVIQANDLQWSAGGVTGVVTASLARIIGPADRQLAGRLSAGEVRVEGGLLKVLPDAILESGGDLRVASGATLGLVAGARVEAAGSLDNAGTVVTAFDTYGSGGVLQAGATLNRGALLVEGGEARLGALTNENSGTVVWREGRLAVGRVANTGNLDWEGLDLVRDAAEPFGNGPGGSVKLTQASLDLAGGEGGLGGGTYYVPGPQATLTYRSGQYAPAAIESRGLVVVDGGTVTVTAVDALGPLEVRGGDLSVTATALFRDLSVSGGTLGGAATVQADALTLSGTGRLAGTGSLSVADFRGQGGSFGNQYRVLDLARDGDFVVPALQALESLRLEARGGELRVREADLLAPDIVLAGATITVSAAQVGGEGTRTLAVTTPGLLYLDGRAGPAKLLASRSITVSAGALTVEAGLFPAGIDPDTLSVDVAGPLQLLGGSGDGAAATLLGGTVDLSAGSLLLQGGTGAGASAGIAASTGALQADVSGAVVLVPGAGPGASVGLSAATALSLAAGSCLDCAGFLSGNPVQVTILTTAPPPVAPDNSAVAATQQAGQGATRTVLPAVTASRTQTRADDDEEERRKKDQGEDTGSSRNNRSTRNDQNLPICP